MIDGVNLYRIINTLYFVLTEGRELIIIDFSFTPNSEVEIRSEK